MVTMSAYGLISIVLAYLYHNKLVTMDLTYYCRCGKSLVSPSCNQSALQTIVGLYCTLYYVRDEDFEM
jgi:CDGSH-type Zn-finger protein